MPEPVAARAVGTARQRFAWCLYDFANSAYPTVVITFVYGAWYRGRLAPDTNFGDASWAWSMALSGVLVAVLAPIAGYLADHRGATFRYLVTTSIVVVLGTAVLYAAAPDPALGHGTPATIAWVLAVVVVTNALFELAFVFYNAFLPRLAGPMEQGKLSGNGWAFGYVGGLASLFVCLALFPGDGAPAAELDAAVRSACLVVAGWFALFGFFALRGLATVPPPVRVGIAAVGGGGGRTTLRQSLRGVWGTVRHLPRFPDLMRLLIARLIYNDAVMALIGLAALYMGGQLAMSPTHILWVAVGLNVAAGLGAWVFGLFEARLGGRWVVVVSLWMLIGGAVLALAVPTVEAFYLAALLIGIALGPNQAASRSLLGRFVPVERSTEFYGLFALSGKATVWIGPALFALLVWATESQRIALLPIVVMLVIGLVLVLAVDERRGAARAAAFDDDDSADGAEGAL